MSAPKGNKNAAKAKLWEQALKRALARATSQSVDAGLDRMADKTVAMALNDGERWAIEHIADRLDGKPSQQIEHTGDIGVRHSTELTDSELERIATGSSPGASETAQSTH